MTLTRESRRACWGILLGTWVAAAGLILAQTFAMRGYIALLDELARPEAPLVTPLQQVIPARFADAQMWLRHALDTQQANQLRSHYTQADNAPFGRDVHWSSSVAWLLRAAGRIQTAVTGQRGAVALERALLWLNAPLLFAVLVGLSGWSARRAGAGAGVIVAFAMIGHARFYEGFLPAYIDHHGLINAATLGLVLGFAFAGAGWWRPETPGGFRWLPTSERSARRAATVSAACGAAGVWLGAATVLPVIAILGMSALTVSWWRGRRALADGVRFDPGVLRRWGRVGAGASMVFYLLEYAPANLGLRLEVNHPLYSAGWWGGAELVALLATGRSTRGAEPWRRLVRRLALPVLAMSAAPLTILLGGTAVFLVADPFVGELRHYVTEGKSLPATIRELGFDRVWSSLAWTLVLVPAAVLLCRRREDLRLVLGLLTLVVIALVLMSVWEMRWWMSAAAAQIALCVALLAALPAASTRWRWGWIGAFTVLILVGPAARRIAAAFAENRAHAVTEVDLLPPLYRDIAARLRESQPDGEIVLLSNPNASAGISHYGRFKSLGTLFWENAPGLRAAAEIFSAETDDAARAAVRARGLTHVAMLSSAHFLGGYYRLLHPGSSDVDAKRSFGYRLLANQPTADWLQPIPYRVPEQLKLAGTTVRLYKVAFGQTEAERLYHTIIAHAAAGDSAGADETWRHLSSRVPAAARASVAAEVGQGLYEFGLHAMALRIYRSILDTGYDPGIANTYAWILSTSDDAAVRDGQLALKMMEPLLRNAPTDPAVLSSFAAACAEVGRFGDAVRAAERALDVVRAAGNAGAEPLLQRRLEAYRAGRPWRQ